MNDVTIAPARATEPVVLSGINWRALPGDFWIVGGLLGSGRSDFVSTAAGLQEPAHGSVKIFGRELAGLREEDIVAERKRIGIVFEGGGKLFNHLTVAENVALPLRYHNDWSPDEAEGQVRLALQETGLEKLAGHRPTSLTSSWQHRVGLARALALRPEILFVDKPMSGLDLRHRPWWLEFLSQLSRGTTFTAGKPVTLVITADDLKVWSEPGRQFAVLKNRQLVVVGGHADLGAGDHAALQEAWEDDLISE